MRNILAKLPRLMQAKMKGLVHGGDVPQLQTLRAENSASVEAVA